MNLYMICEKCKIEILYVRIENKKPVYTNKRVKHLLKTKQAHL